jgi:hypothetical protein
MTYATTSLQRSNLTVWLEITTGFDDVAEVRGHDTVVPHLAGRIARNRKKDVRGIELTGWVQGTGSTEAARLSSYRDLVDELQTLFDPVRVPAALGRPLDPRPPTARRDPRGRHPGLVIACRHR